MNDLIKNATRLAGRSGAETVLLDSENVKDNNTGKPPSEAEACLHSCIASLNRNYSPAFTQHSESVLNRIEEHVTVKRYSPANIGQFNRSLLVCAKLGRSRYEPS